MLILLMPQSTSWADDSPYTENRHRLALKQSMKTMTADQFAEFSQGRRLFEQMWVIAPSLDDDIDGLGPLYNSISCLQCHPANGRGHAPDKPEQKLDAMLVRLSQLDKKGNIITPHPVYGEQLQDKAVPSVKAEGHVSMAYRYFNVTLKDGTAVPMREPKVMLSQAAYTDFSDVLTSARIGPALIGMGFINAIPAEQIIANADPDDLNGDGISGRVNWIKDSMTGLTHIGRFGYKANVASLKAQVVNAFHGDLGITSSIHPKENCTLVQSDCLKALSGGEPELREAQLNAVTVYMQLLAIPKPLSIDNEQLLLGQQMFNKSNCLACHHAKFTTSKETKPQQLASTTISPYSDFLLHDMGEGLADGRPDQGATGREWRTTPLWAIGLSKIVNSHANYLHDGRARTLLEAILWHGGEAQASQQAVINMSSEQREALLNYLQRL
ncbi:CxxC motif-containing protein, DUF1111 family [Methylophaga sulfidovorans]|uniref:CxxC motif-containing protein, DUF1111 family n=2 Tax=Methylophaga sulfidovorans TaxID=45496 RepID=A0A1I4A9Z3_9GAMM|nr:CxxC motif-containing protein, DUF1111 family [Methylophaga sulfidovorans]